MSGIIAKKSIVINREPAHIYSFWHNFENLPLFISHLESIKEVGDGISMWSMKIPFGHITWYAETKEDIKNEKISWRSLPGSDIENSGEVLFKKTEDGKGTEVTVNISFDSPEGFNNSLAAVLNLIASDQIVSDLERLKEMMEKG